MKSAKGYEIAPDSFVLVEEEDLAKIEPEASTAIEVPHFLPEGKIGHQYYDRPYYLGPDGHAKAYFALAEALARKKREGLARWVMRKKHYIGALRSLDGYLLLITGRCRSLLERNSKVPSRGGSIWRNWER